MDQGAFDYCRDVVREQDADRFLLSQFAKAEHREALWALFAFNYEIAKTREVVSETRLGLIRLQWWREAIEEIYGDADLRDHQVVRALQNVIHAYDLPQEWFETLIYAREFDLEDVAPSALEGLLHYVDYTSTPLMKMAVSVTGGDADSEPVHPVAVNYALMGVLRSVLHLARQRRCLLPEALMQAHGVYMNQLYDPPSRERYGETGAQEGLSRVVEEVAGVFVEGIETDNRFLRASQRLSRIYMKQLRRCGYDVFHPRMQISPAFKELRLLLGL